MLKPLRGRRPAEGRPPPEGASPIDIHVGTRVRLRRTLLGISQEKLGEAVGLTFQQIQKYERGANRIGASRLHELSRILDVPVSFFFDDMADGEHRMRATDAGSVGVGAGAGDGPASRGDVESNTLAKPETLDLVRAYYRIPEPTVRKRLFELVKAVAAAGGGVEKSE